MKRIDLILLVSVLVLVGCVAPPKRLATTTSQTAVPMTVVATPAATRTLVPYATPVISRRTDIPTVAPRASVTPCARNARGACARDPRDIAVDVVSGKMSEWDGYLEAVQSAAGWTFREWLEFKDWVAQQEKGE